MKRRLSSILLTLTALSTQGQSLSALAFSADVIKPVLTGDNTLTLGVSHPISVLQLASLLIISDNVSLIAPEDVELVSTTCNLDVPSLGDCDVIVSVSDEAGNVSDPFTFSITFVDDTKPVITGPTDIYKHPHVSLILDDILTLFDVYDNDTAEIELQILDDAFTGFGDEEGVYSIRFKAEDSIGNSFYHKLDIHVDDAFPKALLIQDDEEFRFLVNHEEVINTDQILNALRAAEFVSTDAAAIEWTLNEYDGFEDFVGFYDLSLRMDFASGVREDLAFQIEVDSSMGKVIIPNPNIFQIIGQFLADAWEWLKGAFNWILGRK